MVSFHSRPAGLFSGPSVMNHLCYHVKEGQLGGLRQCSIFLAVRGAAATSTTTNVRDS